jgi:hypothetical protein
MRKPKQPNRKKTHSEFKKGCIPWNKGKHHSEETKRKIIQNNGKNDVQGKVFYHRF